MRTESLTLAGISLWIGLTLPAVATANAFWPPVLVQNVGFWIVPVTIVIEAIFIWRGLRSSAARALAASALANIASALVGFVVLYPVMRMDSVIQALVDFGGPVAILPIMLASILLSIVTEIPVVSWVLGARASRRLTLAVSAANFVTTAATIWVIFQIEPWR